MKTANMFTSIVEHNGVICVKSLIIGTFDLDGTEGRLAVVLNGAVEQVMRRIGAQGTADGAMMIDTKQAEQALKAGGT